MFHIFSLISAQKLPIDRHETWANLNGYKLDIGNLLSKMQSTKTYYFSATPPDSTWTYYVIPGDDFDSYVQYIPGWDESYFDDYTNETLDYVSVIRCDTTAKICQSCITLNDWDWAFIDNGNPKTGFIYMADGQPIKSNPKTLGSTDITVDVDFYFYYDSSASTDIPNFEISYDESMKPNVRIIFSAKTALIPQPAQTNRPSPTPTPFKPLCRYYERLADNPNRGYDFNIDTINTGPYGNRLKGKIGDQNYTIFYQPCERSTCPPRYNCSSATWASIWLCSDEDSKYTKACIDGGSILDEKLNLQLYTETNPPYAVQTFTDHLAPDEETSTTVTLVCDTDLPQGHVELESMDYDSSTKMISLLAHTEEVCSEPLPNIYPPNKLSPACKISRFSNDKRYYIAMDLVTHNGNPYWYSSNVQVDGTLSSKTAELYYQPCGAIQCPYPSQCEGHDDATIWLCFQNSSSKHVCRSYGDFDLSYHVDLEVESYLDPTFSSGLEADYYTNDSPAGKVYLNCNWGLPAGQIGMPTTVTVSDNRLYFNVTTVQACSVGPPNWHPPSPSLGKTPTPTPQPSPNSIDFLCNETHYIYTNLEQMSAQNVFSGTLKLGYNGVTSKTVSFWTVWYHPWTHIPCPDGNYCFGFNQSNIWGCWVDDNSTNVCFPVGDVDYGNDVRMRGDSLDNGAELIFTGAWGVETEMNVVCNQNAEENSIELDEDAVSSWTTNNGNRVLFELDSQYVCPLEFQATDPIAYVPSPTPIPEKYSGPYYFKSAVINNSFASINLKKLKKVELAQVYVGYRTNLVKMKLVFSASKKVTCPTGYRCLGDAPSNLWFCGVYNIPNEGNKKDVCKPAGDIDAGLVVDPFDDLDPMSGIVFNYDGGYGNYTETHVVFQCNSSVPKHQVVVDPVVQRQQPRGSYSMYIVRAHTSDVCPYYHRVKVTSGALFLTLLYLAAIVYFFGFFIFSFIRDSKAEMPNNEFWENVLNSIIALFTCESCRSGSLNKL